MRFPIQRVLKALTVSIFFHFFAFQALRYFSLFTTRPVNDFRAPYVSVVLMQPRQSSVPHSTRNFQQPPKATIRSEEVPKGQNKSLSIDGPSSHRNSSESSENVSIEEMNKFHSAQSDSPIPPAQPEILSTEPILSELESVESVLMPCRGIQLPTQWIQLQGVWPRRYNVEILVKNESKDVGFQIAEMKALDEQYAALDARVRDSFADCLQRQTKPLRKLQENDERALNKNRGGAYSMIIEFFPSNDRVADQQGF